MLNAIVYCLLIFFVLMGVISGVYVLMLLIMRPKAVGRFIVVIPPHATEADVASLLCAARLRVALMGDLCRSEIIALDCGMTEHCKLQCMALCSGLDHTAVMTPEDLMNQLTANRDE